MVHALASWAHGPRRVLEHGDVTDLERLAGLYVVWLAVNGCLLWVLAGWSARQQHLHAGLVVVAAIVSLFCIGLVVNTLTERGSPGSPLVPRLGRDADALLLSFIVWPLASCIAVVRAFRRFSLSPRATCWLSFAAGMLIALLCPFAVLVAGCGLAGACF
jgi:hypothetical protein